MNKMKTLTAVVVGDDHQNTLGVIRSLGERGCRVIAVIFPAGRICSTSYSKYIDEVFLIQRAELIDTLVGIGNPLEQKTALIPCGDDIAAAVDRAHELLCDWYYLPSAGAPGSMGSKMNKMVMLELARSAGLKVPEWVSIERKDFHLLNTLCGGLRFPCILKPVGLMPGGIFEFRILHTIEELLAAQVYITENCQSIIVQEYIRKTGEYGVNACRLYHSGETIFGGVIEKKRFSQSSLGSTTAGVILPDCYGLCEAARRFVEYIDYRGIFDMEFIWDGEEIYFVEMNFRNGGYGYAYTNAGRNFPAIWASEACCKDITGFLKERLRSVFFINESADLQNVRAGNISIFTWFRDTLRAKAHMYINLRDMRPLLKKIRK